MAYKRGSDEDYQRGQMPEADYDIDAEGEDPPAELGAPPADEDAAECHSSDAACPIEDVVVHSKVDAAVSRSSFEHLVDAEVEA